MQYIAFEIIGYQQKQKNKTEIDMMLIPRSDDKTMEIDSVAI
jgi:hypothetical protein